MVLGNGTISLMVTKLLKKFVQVSTNSWSLSMNESSVSLKLVIAHALESNDFEAKMNGYNKIPDKSYNWAIILETTVLVMSCGFTSCSKIVKPWVLPLLLGKILRLIFGVKSSVTRFSFIPKIFSFASLPLADTFV